MRAFAGPAWPATLALSCGAGAALSFAFAPWERWPLAPLALLVLYALLLPLTPRRAAWTGFAFGLGYFGLGVNWVYHSLHLFGGATATFAALLTVLLVVVEAVFTTLVAWGWARLRSARPSPASASGPTGYRSAVRDAWLFAAAWSMAELGRNVFMGGFPWILVGYSQTSGPLGALAPVVGTYGIGFLLVGATASLLPLALPAARHPRLAGAASVAVVGLAGLAATTLSFSAPKDTVLGVRLTQANIAQEMKFSPERLQRSLREYLELSLDGLPDDIDVVVWPETAIPTTFENVERALAPWVADFEARGVDVLAGGFEREGDESWNAVRQLGGERQSYRKRHLVPFGEYMPMRGLLEGLAAFIQIPGTDLSAGTGPHVPLRIRGESIGLSICYEDVFGEEMRELVPEAGVLVNVSNDAWFGDSAAPHQHEQKARMRARELARPMIRVTNTGVSSSIAYDGTVEGRIPQNRRGVLDVRVVPRTGTTWYARTGNWPVFAAACIGIVLAFAARVRERAPAPGRISLGIREGRRSPPR